MLYGIDAESANVAERTGVEWYAYHLIENMKKHALQEGERVRLYSRTPLQGALAELPAGWESCVLPWKLPGWMRFRMSVELHRRPPNVFFVPSQGLPLLPWHNRKQHRVTFTTIHDVGFARMPELYDTSGRRRLIHATREAIRYATDLFVVSEFTKREVMDVYHVPEDRIVVTPLAYDSSVFYRKEAADVDAVLARYRLGRNFFLHVGRWERKKNLLTLLRAFEEFKSTRGMGDPFELVLVGKPGGFGYEEIKQWLRVSPARMSIRTLLHVPSEDTAALMNAATAFVFPSWYEGFGIPNLEALACGTPLLTSDIPAHREVVGDAAVFLPPEVPEAWAKAMHDLVLNASQRLELVEKGLRQVQKFSWDQTAGRTLDTLRANG